MLAWLHLSDDDGIVLLAALAALALVALAGIGAWLHVRWRRRQVRRSLQRWLAEVLDARGSIADGTGDGMTPELASLVQRPDALATAAVVTVCDDLAGLAMLVARVMRAEVNASSDRQHPGGGVAQVANGLSWWRLQSCLRSYVEALCERLATDGHIDEAAVNVFRATGRFGLVPAYGRYADSAARVLSEMHPEVRMDLLRLVSAEQQIQMLLRQEGMTTDAGRQACSLASAVREYVLQLSTIQAAESGGRALTPEEVLWSCRSAVTKDVLDSVDRVCEVISWHADGNGSPETRSYSARLAKACAVAIGVCQGPTTKNGRQAQVSANDQARDERRWSDEELVEQGVLALLAAWHSNEEFDGPDGETTSRVHLLSSLVRRRSRTVDEERENLQRTMSDFMCDEFKIKVRPLDELAGGVAVLSWVWARPAAVAFVAEQYTLAGIEDAVLRNERLVREIVISFCFALEDEIGWWTVYRALLTMTHGDGFFGRQLQYAELSDELRVQLKPFNGSSSQSLFFVDEAVEGPNGCVGRYCSMTVWSADQMLAGCVGGYVFTDRAASAEVAWSAADLRFVGARLGDEGWNLVHAACEQFGGAVVGQWPFLIVSSIERRDGRTQAGFGAELLKAFVAEVRREWPAVATVTMNCEPPEFSTNGWEEALSTFESGRFLARNKLQEWFQVRCLDDLRGIGVKRAFALELPALEEDELPVAMELDALEV